MPSSVCSSFSHSLTVIVDGPKTSYLSLCQLSIDHITRMLFFSSSNIVGISPLKQNVLKIIKHDNRHAIVLIGPIRLYYAIDMQTYKRIIKIENFLSIYIDELSICLRE